MDTSLCEHETFKDICNVCHRDNLIDNLRNQIQCYEHIATVLTPDPYDERNGPYFSQDDLKKINDLKSGDMIYVVRRKK